MTVSEFLDILETRGYQFNNVAGSGHEHFVYRGRGVTFTLFADSENVQWWITSLMCGGGFPLSMPAAAVNAQLALLESVALPDLVAA